MVKYFFIINPAAGNGNCLNVWHRIEKLLKYRGISYIHYLTKYPGHAKELAVSIATEHAGKEVNVIAVGGDGTVHEAVNGIAAFPHISFGFIPGGSGNDFCRGFGIPENPVEALECLFESGLMSADAGEIALEHGKEKVVFINNMGVGFDALVSLEVNRSKAKGVFNKLSLGRLVYVYFLLKKLASYKRSNINVTIDGTEHLFNDAWFLTVSNQPYYGGGMKIAPQARTDDGQFNITAVHQLSRLKLLLVFISVFWGKHVHFKEVKTFTGKHITVKSSIPIHVHADGEYIGFTPLVLQLKRRAVHILSAKQKIENMEEREINECY